MPEANAAFLHVSQALRRVELVSMSAGVVVPDLPSYDGLLNPVLSPDGAYFAYRLNEPDRSGIYVVDTRTRKEAPLLADGDSMSFFPQWSPDSKWLVAYTAPKDPGRPKEGVYQVFQNVDGPLPIAPSATVVSVWGFDSERVMVPGKLLSGVRWAADGRTLSFQAGSVKPTDTVVPNVQWVQESLWVEPVNVGSVLNGSIPEKAADLPRVTPVWFGQLPISGKAVYYSPDGVSIMRGAPGAAPAQVADGARFGPEEWWPSPYPVMGHLVVAWMWPEGAETKALWLLGAHGAAKVAEYKDSPGFRAGVTACGDGVLVVYHSDRKVDPLGQFDVFLFNPDELVPRYAPGDPLGKVREAVTEHQAEGAEADDIIRIIGVNEDYCLAELKPRGDEFLYLYVRRDGTQVRPAVSHVYRPVFGRCENGKVWFRCDRGGDCYTVFPFYAVTRPEEHGEEMLPASKVPDGEPYEISIPGLAYRVSDAVFAITGIFMQMDVTGPAEGGVIAGGGGGRPPRTSISEDGEVVTFRFEDVSLPPFLKERLLSYENPFAKVLTVAIEEDSVEIAVRVTGEYSLEFAAVIPGRYESDLNAPLGGSAVNIRFRRDSEDGAAGADAGGLVRTGPRTVAYSPKMKCMLTVGGPEVQVWTTERQ